MSERVYTVREIDALRTACKDRYLYGAAIKDQFVSRKRWSRVFQENEMVHAVEEHVRTYILAGIVAEDLYAEDRSPKESAS